MATCDAPSFDPRKAAEPAEAKTLALNDGGRFTYAGYGDPDGIPVVFLHGTPGSRLLEALSNALAKERGIRALAPGEPGYGCSSSCPIPEESGDPNQRPTEPTPVDFFDASLGDIGAQSVGVVAFSGGSRDALAVTSTQPGRVRYVSAVARTVPSGAREEIPDTQRPPS